MSGRSAYYVEMAARAGLIGIHTVAAPPVVAPLGGAKAALGTNPIAFGFPLEGDALVIDLGTSAFMGTDLQFRQRLGIPLPEGRDECACMHRALPGSSWICRSDAGLARYRLGRLARRHLPACRATGVPPTRLAQTLVAEAERRLAARGARRLSAMVARDEPQAVAFWNAAPSWAREARWQRYAKNL